MKTVFKEKEHLGMDWPILSLFCFKILSLTSTMLLLLSVRCYCFKGLGKANIRSAQKISLGLCSSSSLLVMDLFFQGLQSWPWLLCKKYREERD